ncbi:hybrid sensor histidine kinase/response regulator [Deltaproteobacteria bacterium Smac51]|nr:hybrid sensor histidine kinase/response regulator [Deltaproteobacteria bacterium Smac51]
MRGDNNIEETYNYDLSRSLAMLEGSPHAHLLFDDRLHIIDCSCNAIKLFGFDSREAMLKGFFKRAAEVVAASQTADCSVRLFEALLRLAAQKGRLDYETEITVDGCPKEVDIHFKLLPAEGSFVISSCIADTTTLRRAQNELIRKDQLLQSLNQVASVLMTASPEDFDLAIWRSLETIGRAVNVDRSYIWENFEDGGKLYSRQIYEWSEGAEPQQGKEFAEALLYDDVPYWRDQVMSGQALNSPVSRLPETERVVLEPQDIKSILVLPIMLKGEPWGYIGFDDCREERFFSETEERLLLSGGNIIVSAITRNKATNDLQKQIIAARRASEANQSKSSFLARTSHEIRTPMNSIIGMAELALREDISQEVRSHISDIKHAGISLLAIINDILDFSKIESGKIEIVPVSYMLSSLLNDVISIIRLRVAKKGLIFTVNIDGSLPDELYGDSIRIRQALINILDNAVKYTKEGFVAFNVTGRPDPYSNTVELSFAVEDSGCGIKPEDFDKLFLDFVQLDAHKNWGVVGTGLGLTITRTFVKTMGGDITVESEYGRGSTFSISLPQSVQSKRCIAEVNDPEEKAVLMFGLCERSMASVAGTCGTLGVRCDIARTISDFTAHLLSGGHTHVLVMDYVYEEAVKAFEKSGQRAALVVIADIESQRPAGGVQSLALPLSTMGLANLLNGIHENKAGHTSLFTFSAPEARILIVDDNATNLKVAVGLMKPYNMIIDTCLSGPEALKLLENKNYDLVLMDHMMPEMDGIETTQCIRQLGETDDYFTRLPVIALTANAVSGMREMFLNNGMNGYLSKPIDVGKLHRELERWLPPDKLKSPEPLDESADGESGETIEIEGLDTRLGMSQTGGSLKKYCDVLSSYCTEGMKISDAVSACLAENDLARFTIYIHALKSSSASIGAPELSQRAARLEKAGAASDRKVINSEINEFLNDLEWQIGRIRAALIEVRPHGKAALGDPAMLRGRLRAVGKAIDEVDMNEAHRLLEELKDYDWLDEIEAELEKLSDNILMCDLVEAGQRIKCMLVIE